jgi:branched-chain amino acid aminotransferase
MVNIKMLKRTIISTSNKTTFGSTFSSSMYLQNYERNKGWFGGGITDFRKLELSPSAAIFHYGQAIFEGMKAYKNTDGRVFLFRPEENLKRFNQSAYRMAMPQIDVNDHLEAIVKLVCSQKNSIPEGPDGALYIRPTMIATEDSLNVSSSTSYSHFIITSPVTSYFGTSAIDVLVSENHFRAVPGGVGHIKTAGNYASSYFVSEQAKAVGCDQVLWLDSKTRKNIEEIGAMNIFFVYENGSIVTPQLSGSILPGITRDSIIELALRTGVEVEQKSLSIDDVIEDIKNGDIVEIFGTGTAAAVTNVKAIHHKGERVSIAGDPEYKKAKYFRDTLLNLQFGNSEDLLNWRREI